MIEFLAINVLIRVDLFLVPRWQQQQLLQYRMLH